MVSVGRTYLDRKAAEQRSELRWGEEARPNNINGWQRRQRIAVFNYVLQAIATAAALFSLADRHQLVWPSLVAGLVVVSLVLIAWQAMKAGEDAIGEWMANR